MESGVLVSNLLRRDTDERTSRPKCGGNSASGNDYNEGLHIMALFVVLFQSAFACAFPLLAKRFPSLRIPPSVLFVLRHFGTGVLIATAFVHLLPTAFISLLDPCLPEFWNKKYPAMPGAIAMAAVFAVTTVEMVFTGVQIGEVEKEARKAADISEGEKGEMRLEVLNRKEREDDSEKEENSERPTSSGSGTSEGTIVVDSTDEPDRGRPRSRRSLSISKPTSPNPTLTTQPSIPLTLNPTHHLHRTKLQLLLLELGILTHSLFIGLTLSLTTGPPFTILLIAILFHQTFEGLALGSRIALVPFPTSSPTPWILASCYGLTTPIGQALGLALRRSWEVGSESGLVAVGVMNAVSAGLLVYAGLVELLAEDFLTEGSWAVLRGRKRVLAGGCVLAGAVGMSLVGAWA